MHVDVRGVAKTADVKIHRLQSTLPSVMFSADSGRVLLQQGSHAILVDRVVVSAWHVVRCARCRAASLPYLLPGSPRSRPNLNPRVGRYKKNGVVVPTEPSGVSTT